MIISACSKISSRIFQYTADKFESCHRIITFHYGDICCRYIFITSGEVCPVCTVTIIIFLSDFVDSGIFKHIWCVNCDRVAIQTYHIICKFYNSSAFWILDKIFRLVCCVTNSSKVQISGSVIINQYSRVKQPSNLRSGTSRGIAADQLFSNWVFPWPCRTVCFQHSNSTAIVSEIQEEFFFSINCLMTCCRCPGI